MPEELLISLQDTFKPDNQKFYNLLDRFKWNDVIDRVREGEPLEKLMQEMINDTKQSR